MWLAAPVSGPGPTRQFDIWQDSRSYRTSSRLEKVSGIAIAGRSDGNDQGDGGVGAGQRPRAVLILLAGCEQVFGFFRAHRFLFTRNGLNRTSVLSSATGRALSDQPRRSPRSRAFPAQGADRISRVVPPIVADLTIHRIGLLQRRQRGSDAPPEFRKIPNPDCHGLRIPVPTTGSRIETAPPAQGWAMRSAVDVQTWARTEAYNRRTRRDLRIPKDLNDSQTHQAK